ncbi:hypothetical protein [Adhaeribacter terrigena]|nr:hypothetical protein [Adhaeribacter terrigena]
MKSSFKTIGYGLIGQPISITGTYFERIKKSVFQEFVIPDTAI